MKHLVLGGMGFLGSHLCEWLVERGEDVIAFDNLFTGRRENAAHLNQARFEFVRGDVCDQLPHFEVDRIWSLACPASPVHYAKNPVRTIKTGVMGTINALELAREVGARVLIASTSEVYGDPRVHPQPETYWGNVNPIGPRACYDESKRVAESLAMAWCQQFSTDIRIARIHNTYGPRMASGDGRLIPNFITQTLAGKPMTIYGDGKQTRSLCYVSDLIRGLTGLMECKLLYKPMPINIGNPDERTVGDIALAVAKACGVPLAVEEKPMPEDDPRQRCPDITRARKYLGWEPTVSLEDGLAKTVAWFVRSALLREHAVPSIGLPVEGNGSAAPSVAGVTVVDQTQKVEPGPTAASLGLAALLGLEGSAAAGVTVVDRDAKATEAAVEYATSVIKQLEALGERATTSPTMDRDAKAKLQGAEEAERARKSSEFAAARLPKNT